MKIAVFTLGCKANQFESQAIEKRLTERGHELVPFDSFFNACVINTCSVTAIGDKKSRQAIRRAKKTSPGAIIAVCGCYSQLKPDESIKIGADIVLGSGNKLSVIDKIEALTVGKAMYPDDLNIPDEFENLPAGGSSGRTRAYLKIQDGCENFCTYCIIPYARGPSRSASVSYALNEVIRLEETGCGEVILTGIEISSYHDKDTDLCGLVSALHEKTMYIRFRLGSLEPRLITMDFCQRLAGCERLCPQFHMSLQSGSDRTLKRMGRKYDTARFYEAVKLLRRYFENPAITADLITGFPGESEAEFCETLEFIRKCGFASMHIFPYSERPGTAAAVMAGSVAPEIRRTRAAAAAEAAGIMKTEYLESLIGKPLNVLFESGGNGESRGHAANGVLVYTGEGETPGSFTILTAVRLYKDGLWGEKQRCAVPQPYGLL